MTERDERWVLDLLHQTADVIRGSLGDLDRRLWGDPGERAGQYRADLVADAAAVALLDSAGVGALSEESGLHHPERSLLVVIDPLDGSTNAAYRIPWYATSLCALDAEGPFAAVVVDLAHGTRFEAVRGGGARCDGVAMTPTGATTLGSAVVGLSGWPPRPIGSWQFRALGALALDLCAVASGALDGYVDCSVDAHGPWDYLGGALVCQEAGASITDAMGRDLVVRDPSLRRTPVAAATPDLLDQLLAARTAW